MSDESRRLVLESGFAPGGIDALALRNGWVFAYHYPPGSTSTSEYVWRIDVRNTFHYFECVNYPVQYCIVVGPENDQLLMVISQELDFLDVPDLALAFDSSSTPEERAITTYALGIAAGRTVDPLILDRILKSFSDEYPIVRLAAIDAAFVSGWEAFQAEFSKLANQDIDPTVRATAANAISGLNGAPQP